MPKPSFSWCRHCEIGKGCKIYEKGRPDECKVFKCNWLQDTNVPDELRPDKIHMYAVGGVEDKIVRIVVDDEHPEAPEDPDGKYLVEGYRYMGNHVILHSKDQVKFLCGHGREKPAKLVLDWTL